MIKIKKKKRYWLWDAVVQHFGGECEYCQSRDNLHLHHTIPLSRGGQNTLGNLQLVCRKCHLDIHRQLQKIWPVKRVPTKFECAHCGRPFYKDKITNQVLCKHCYQRKIAGLLKV